jgi:acetyltransferase-like isoleucine patch superfamily enzyme
MINNRVLIIIASCIALFPVGKIRIMFYRKILGYNIKNCYIGWNTVIAVRQAVLTDCRVGRFNKFIGPIKMTISTGARIGNANNFGCGWWTEDAKFNTANYQRELTIGPDTLITSNHYFDIVGSFRLGKGSWIAGSGSQFWTHDGISTGNLEIGDNSYIGSAVRFAPETSIADNTLVGIGSIVTKKISDNNLFIAGNPAKVIRSSYDWRKKVTLEFPD